MSDELVANFTLNNTSLNAQYEISEVEQIDSTFKIYANATQWGNIQGDIADQTDLIDLIDTKIDIEATARENNDLLLQNGISTLNDDLTAEISNRGTADGILQGNIDTLSGTVSDNYTTLDGKITDEATARGNADSTLDGKIGNNKTAIDNHIADKTNPHEVTKSQVGLGNVDNTSDLNKPISTATQNALNGKANTSDLSTVATTGDYDDLSNKPTIPTVNDATLTIQKNGSNVATFTANSSTNQTANITVPTQASDIGALPDTTTINDLTTAEQQSALNSGANTTNIGQIATNTQNISNEVTNRQNADNNLQSQIDALVVASDVFDIVGTYAELQAYDISTVPVNDIIKVLVDSTHDNAATYYRCVENDNIKSWSYIGAEGAYYTKSEADNRFVEQTTTINGQALSNNITLDASDVGALPDSTTIGNGTLTIQKNGSTIDSFGANDTGNTTVNITVPTDTGDLTNNAGFITGINSTDVTTALGYTPYDSTNPDGYTDNVGTVTSVNNTQPDTNGNVTISIPAAQVNSDWNASSGVAQILNKPTLSTVATSGSYNDLSNKPTIPTVNNATLTIQKNGSAVKTFTANASADVTCNITVPTKTSDITNDSGYITGITSSDVTTALGYTPYNSTNPSGYQANVIETVKVNGTAQTVTSKAVNISVPTKVSQLTNDSGYTTNTGTVTSVNNVSPVNGNVTLTIPSEVTESTVSGWGFTKNTGTVTSVNNVSPVNGNVSLSIPTVPTNISAFNNDSGYITGINSTDVTTALGYTPESTSNKVTSISSSSTDTEYPSAKSVVELLKTIYPVGAVFLSTNSTCPLSELFGTWTLVSSGRALWTGTGSDGNTTIPARLPNITGGININAPSIPIENYPSNAFKRGNAIKRMSGDLNKSGTQTLFDASLSNSIYGNSTTVQPPAYVVNVWRRTA